MTEKGCDNCYYSYFDERAYPCSLCIRGIERTDMWQPSRKTKATISKMEQVDKDINVRSKTEPQTERAETMSCQECKWWFTDSLKHGGYCQSLLYNHECHYEPEVDCRRCIHFATDKCQECFGKELFIDSGYITKLGQPETDCSWK